LIQVSTAGCSGVERDARFRAATVDSEGILDEIVGSMLKKETSSTRVWIDSAAAGVLHHTPSGSS